VTMMRKGNGGVGRSSLRNNLSWGLSDALMGA
jgi:hypothetical protein